MQTLALGQAIAPFAHQLGPRLDYAQRDALGVGAEARNGLAQGRERRCMRHRMYRLAMPDQKRPPREGRPLVTTEVTNGLTLRPGAWVSSRPMEVGRASGSPLSHYGTSACTFARSSSPLAPPPDSPAGTP